jgi:hypothetical protein
MGSNSPVEFGGIGEVADFRGNIRHHMKRVLRIGRGDEGLYVGIVRILDLGSYDAPVRVPDDEHVSCRHIYAFPPPVRLNHVGSQPGLAVFSTRQLYDQSVPPFWYTTRFWALLDSS